MKLSTGIAGLMAVGLCFAANRADAIQANCDGYYGSMSWWTSAYGSLTVSLWDVSSGSPVLVETQTSIASQSAAGTLVWTGGWNSVPLSGIYKVVAELTLYSGVDYAPRPEQNVRTYTQTGYAGPFTCVPPPPQCGNGKLEAGEQCDDGNSVSGDGCSSCTKDPPPPSCGDGVVNGTERCDDGNTADGDGCSSSCEIERYCGDGTVDEGEQCDDANNANGDGCSSTCTTERVPACGDGTIDAGEQCDDDNTVAGDGCSATCTLEPPPPVHCTYTIGYWKTHSRYASQPAKRTAWPINEDTMLCGQTWYTILRTAPRTNAWYILAHQWIGAKLNVALNASTTPEIDAALARGEALLAGCTISSTDRAVALDAASVLDSFNNGVIGPGHCD
jgi:cysteine-rich repeat protein